MEMDLQKYAHDAGPSRHLEALTEHHLLLWLR